MSAEVAAPVDSKFEIGRVLLLDIVGHSKLLIEEQKERLRYDSSVRTKLSGSYTVSGPPVNCQSSKVALVASMIGLLQPYRLKSETLLA